MLTLYDIDSKDRKPWSPNTLRVSLALKHMGIPFETHWVCFPDIQEVIAKTGLEPLPCPPNPRPYTLPVIDHDGKVIRDSFTIVQYLSDTFDAQAKSPILPRGKESLQQAKDAESLALQGFGPIISYTVAWCYKNVLDDRAAKYQQKKWLSRLGNLDDVLADKEMLREAWEVAQENVKPIAELLNKHPEGPFVLGKQRSFADIVLVSFLEYVRRAEQSAFDKLVGFEPSIAKLYEACSDIL